MFWGRGDSSRLGDREKETLDHIRRLTETNHLIALDADDALTAIRAVEFYSQWESVLKLLRSMKNVALLVGALLAIYWATEGWLVQKIGEIAGGSQ
jgi:hypothetical protein